MNLWVPLLFLNKIHTTMINNSPILDNINPLVVAAVDAIHYGIGKSYDITIIIGQVDDDTWPLWSLQGRDLKELNNHRKKLGLFPLASNDNIPVVNEEWRDLLYKGESVVLIFNKWAFRYKENRDIQGMFEWLRQIYPDINVEKCENSKYDTFFISGVYKEGMEIPPPSPIVEEVALMSNTPEPDPGPAPDPEPDPVP